MPRKVTVPLFIGVVGTITGILSYLADRREVRELMEQAKALISA